MYLFLAQSGSDDRSEEPLADGVAGGGGAGGDAELGEDAGDVLGDDARADEEGLGQPKQQLDLPRSQVVWR